MSSTNPKALRPTLAALAVLAMVLGLTQPVSASETTATVNWVNTLQGGGDGEIYSTATDALGNVYAAGYFGGTYANHAPSITASSSSDMYIAKFNSSGTEVWMKNFGANFGAIVKDIAVDAAGNVYGAGGFCGTTTIGALGAFAPNGDCDGYVLKLNSSGTPVWFKHWGYASGWDQSGGLALDAAGNVYVETYMSKVNLEGAVGIDGITWSATPTGSNAGAVVFKFNSSGLLQYAQALPLKFSFDGYGHPFAVSADGKVLVGGNFTGSIDFGAKGTFASVGAQDAMWLQLSSTGVVDLVMVHGGAQTQTIRGLAYDAANNIYVQGLNVGTVNVAGRTFTTAGSTDTFVSKFDSTASLNAWVTHWGGTNDDDIDGIAVDSAGNVVATGSHKGSFTLGSLGTFTSAAANDGIVIGLKNDGSFSWAKTIPGSSDNEIAWARPSIVSGAVYVAGRFASNMNFGDGATATFNASANAFDGFLEKISFTSSNSTPSQAVTSVQISAISPRLIDAAHGASIKISGANLKKVIAVKLGDSTLTLKVVSDSELQVTLPAHSPGYADVTFITSDGAMPLGNAVRYSDVLNTRFGSITLTNPTKAALASAKAKFATITYTDRVVSKGKKPKVTITLTGRIKN